MMIQRGLALIAAFALGAIAMLVTPVVAHTIESRPAYPSAPLLLRQSQATALRQRSYHLVDLETVYGAHHAFDHAWLDVADVLPALSAAQSTLTEQDPSGPADATLTVQIGRDLWAPDARILNQWHFSHTSRITRSPEFRDPLNGATYDYLKPDIRDHFVTVGTVVSGGMQMWHLRSVTMDGVYKVQVDLLIGQQDHLVHVVSGSTLHPDGSAETDRTVVSHFGDHLRVSAPDGKRTIRA